MEDRITSLKNIIQSTGITLHTLPIIITRILIDLSNWNESSLPEKKALIITVLTEAVNKAELGTEEKALILATLPSMIDILMASRAGGVVLGKINGCMKCSCFSKTVKVAQVIAKINSVLGTNYDHSNISTAIITGMQYVSQFPGLSGVQKKALVLQAIKAIVSKIESQQLKDSVNVYIDTMAGSLIDSVHTNVKNRIA
jgi:hypothetical protein